MDQIFFRDKQNELKGPFTEKQVQEWYRAKWFDGAIPFYFMKNDEKPTAETPTITLDVLTTRFGVGCPFAREGQDRRQEQLDSMEEKLESMKGELSEMRKMEERLKKMEDQLKSLEKASEPAKTASLGEKASEFQTIYDLLFHNPPGADENNCTAEWISPLLKFFLDGYDALASERDPASYWERPDEMQIIQARLGTVLEDPASKALLLRELKKAYLFCASCTLPLQNWKLALLHITNPSHEARAVAKFPIWATLTDLLVDFFDILLATRWINAENAKMESAERRFRNVPINANHLRPSPEFVRNIESRTREEIWRNHLGDETLHDKEIFGVMHAQLKGEMGKRIMNELEEHIRDSQTRCLHCKIVVGPANDYYEHLLGPCHMNRADHLDVITIVVNIHKKDLVK